MYVWCVIHNPMFSVSVLTSSFVSRQMVLLVSDSKREYLVFKYWDWVFSG